MSYALLAFLVLLVLAFGYFMWQSRDTWQWYHITVSSLTLLLGIIFLFPAAGTLKSRSAWHKVKEDLERQLQQLQAEQATLKYGDPSDPVAGEGVLELQQKLHRYSLEAGRRWQNLRAQGGATPTSVTLVQVAPAADLPPGMEAEAPAEAAAPAGDSPLIPEGLVVYGFAETMQDGVETPIPTFHLGEFRVESSSPTQVTLRATGRLENPQAQAITSGQANSWSLYELLPLDAHDLFVADGSESSDDALFGRIDEERVRELLGQGVREETISRYLRDGSRALPNDPPTSRWVKIEFTKAHGIVVDSPEQRGALDGGYFDSSGQAVDSRLQRQEDGTVRFATGDQVILSEEAADELIDSDVAKLVDTYYIRPLNDYRLVLRRVRLRIEALAIRKTQLEFEKEVLEAAIDATVKMLASNQETKLNLEKDIAQLQIERAAIASYNDGVQQSLTGTRQRLTDLYRDNLSLRNDLGEIHRGIEAALR